MSGFDTEKFKGKHLLFFRTIEINIGIITASMSAMPQFFTQSKLFRSSTYSSLRSRLVSDRNRKKTSRIGRASSKPKSSESSGQGQGDAALRGEGWVELQDANHVQASAGERPFDDNDNSSKGILKTVNYGVSLAPQSGSLKDKAIA